MLLPRPEAEDALAKLAADGALDLGAVRLERHGRAVHLIVSNPRYLNAEDQATIDAMEIGVDVAILDPTATSRCCAGGRSSIPNTRGGVSSAAASTSRTSIAARFPIVWFPQRELGFVHKFLRGVAKPDRTAG